MLDQCRPLREDAPAADRVVTDLRVAHVGVIRQPHRDPVRLQLGVDRVLTQPVQVRRIGEGDKVALRVAADADAVHDDEHDRPLGPAECVAFLELVHDRFSNWTSCSGCGDSKNGGYCTIN
jgi:hypothetical protein